MSGNRRRRASKSGLPEFDYLFCIEGRGLPASALSIAALPRAERIGTRTIHHRHYHGELSFFPIFTSLYAESNPGEVTTRSLSDSPMLPG
jgi:hypothetical protein